MRRALLALCVAGFALRAAFLVLEPPVERMGDEPSWLALAVHGLAEGRRPLSPLTRQLHFYPPLYPYFLAVPYLLTGGHAAAQWLQVGVSTLLIPAVGLIASRAFSSRTAVLAAGIVALYPDLAWFAAHFWSETLFLTLLFWGLERVLAAQAHGGLGAALAGGFLLGLAALTRETALPLALLAAVWLAWPGRRPARAAALLLAATLAVVPWTVRNRLVFGAFIPVATYGAFNLWLGNSELDRDEVYRRSDSVPGPVAQYELARREALDAIVRRQPRWILEKVLHEVPGLLEASSEAIVFIEAGAYGQVRPALRGLARAVVAIPWLALALLGLPALALFEPTPPRRLLQAVLAGYVLLHILAFGHHRFHLPLVPVLSVYASALALEPWSPRWGRRLGAALLLVASAAAVLPSLLGPPPS